MAFDTLFLREILGKQSTPPWWTWLRSSHAQRPLEMA